MIRFANFKRHEARAAEARRRIARASALDESAATRAECDAAAILSGVQALLWLVAGVGREASGRFIAYLPRDFGAASVQTFCCRVTRKHGRANPVGVVFNPARTPTAFLGAI
ncbi:MAG: hypothetical protein EON54_00245 [Alcaligenaceae bacterium]|nr:MAG: hypothetical protein EON54_00245 [Alcaligenaceae bacterium]